MSDPKAVRYNKLSIQGIVLWLDYSNLVTLIVAVAIVVAATQNAGVLGFIVTAPLWVFLTVVGVQKRYGVPLPVVYWREFMFMLRKALGLRGQVVRPERVVVPAALGQLNLPGRAGYLQLWETPGGVLTVFDPQLQTASISCLVFGDDFLGASNSSQDARIEAWARLKGSWTLRAGLDRISVLERTTPGTVVAARDYYDAYAVSTLQELRGSYVQSLERVDARVTRHRTQITLTFNTHALRAEIKGNGSGKAGLLSYLDLEVEATAAALRQASFVGIEWTNARTWAGIGRAALDPDYAEVLETREGTVLAGVDPVGIGAMAFQEHRSYVVADSGFHRTFWIHEWPRLETYPGFTKHVVFAQMPDGSPIRHILNIVESPVTIRDALKRIADAKKTWRHGATIRAKRSQDESASDRAEWAALEEQEEELVAGRGEYRYSAYLTVSELSLEGLERASSAMRNALSRSGLEPQVLYCQQAEALMLNAFPTGKGMK